MSCASNISDLVTRLKNHRIFSGKPCNVKKTKVVKECLEILHKFGFIVGYHDSSNNKYEIDVIINSSVLSQNPFFNAISITKPSRKVYLSMEKISLMQRKNPLNLILVSTSCGILTARDCMEKKIGGEVLFIV